MRIWLIVVGLLGLTCAGCGGGQPAGKAGGGQAGAIPANAANPNQVAGPAGANALPAPRPIASADKSDAAATDEQDAEEPVPAGPDDFEINPDITITEVAGIYREPLPPPVEVIKPFKGRDSNTLEIVTAGATESTNPDSVASAATPGATPQPGGATTIVSDGGGWTLPTGATAVEGSGTHPETGLPLRIVLERDPVEMVLIPPGVFLEGIDGRDSNAAPQHAVLLESPYYIDVFEVTVARHDAFREALRKSDGRRMEPSLNHDGNPEAPAVGIKYLDAKFYAKWAGKELPTEAQWERAARGGQGHDFPWGNGRPIWHQAREPGQLDSAGLHPGDRSPFGVFDMAGNAREWCLDIYLPDTFQKDVAGGEPVRNPAGPKAAQTIKLQVVKGGKTDWAVWHRAGQPQNEAGPNIGFRCVLNLSDATTDTGNPKGKSSSKASEKSTDKKAAF